MKQTDIYTEALICLRSILQADHPEFKNWIDWLERDIQDWNQRREVAHHLRAYGGMGSFNDLPSMRGNHDYIFDFLKSVCYAFGHLYCSATSFLRNWDSILEKKRANLRSISEPARLRQPPPQKHGSGTRKRAGSKHTGGATNSRPSRAFCPLVG